MSHVRISCPNGPLVLNQSLTEIFSIVTSLSKEPVAPFRPSYIFRSYHHPAPAGEEREVGSVVQNPRPPNDYPIWQVGCVATNATGYFARMKFKEINYKKIELSVYTITTRNSTQTTTQKGLNKPLLPLTDYDPKATRVVSIDSGQSEVKGRFFTKSKILRGGQLTKLFLGYTLKEMLCDPASRHFRLNVEDTVIGEMPLDTWKGERGSKTLGFIREEMEAYLSSEDARALISDAAGDLVTIRQAKEQMATRPRPVEEVLFMAWNTTVLSASASKRPGHSWNGKSFDGI